MPLVSIIVPVYRAEQFLGKCIDSILAQTLADLELILVDDGSPDKSGMICDQYAQKDQRVIVIHQDNSGAAAARNKGIFAATGEFVGFVDSDDWVKEKMYEMMYAAADEHHAEIVMCDIQTISADGAQGEETIGKLSGSCTLTSKELTPELMPDFGGSACRCIYKRTLLEKNRILFPQGLKFSEDRIFNIYAMGSANCVYYLKELLYVQYVNMGSCVHRYHNDYFEHVRLAAQKTQEAVRKVWEDDPEYQKQYLWHFYYGTMGAVYNVKHTDAGMPWLLKIKEIKKICEDPQLRDALIQLEETDLRGEMLLKKQAVLLYFSDTKLYQKIDNFMDTYKSNGMIGVLEKCIQKLAVRRRNSFE